MVDDPATLLDLDFELVRRRYATGTRPAGHGPLVLVCTNGRRDLCCAEVGRDRVNTLAPRSSGDALWESSHLGGHRFAPTGAPALSGVVLGRADASDVLEALDGRLPLHRYRGRSSLAAGQQAAEAYVLAAIGADQAGRLHVAAPVRRPVRGRWPWHPDGRAWRVRGRGSARAPPARSPAAARRSHR